jgi:DNA-binding NarL/FixJ family response regulator
MNNEPTANGLAPVPSPTPVRVAVVTDVALFREGLGAVLDARPDLDVVAAGPPGADVLRAIAASGAGVVLVDASTVCASDFIRVLADAAPDARAVAFAVTDADRDEVLACAAAGVAGFVPRAGSVEDLVAALHSAVRGEVRCPPVFAALVFRQLSAVSGPGLGAIGEPHLTQRETEIVDLVERGLSNKEIAVRLGIEVATVKNHVHNVLEKLHVHRRGEAAALLRRHERWSRLGANARR